MARGTATSRHLEDMSVRFKRDGAPCFLGSSPIALGGEGAPFIRRLGSNRATILKIALGAYNQVAQHNPGLRFIFATVARWGCASRETWNLEVVAKTPRLAKHYTRSRAREFIISFVLPVLCPAR